MNKKGSIFILFLWVMLFLALFALSVGFRTRLATKIESYDMRRFERTYDFQSAVNLARFFIESDQAPNIDSEADDWYGTPKKSQGIDLSKRFELEIRDEESKINLNKASEPFLIKFFEILRQKNLKLETDPRNLAAAILAWRGQGALRGGPTLGFKHKRAPFETVQELRLIQYITPNDFQVLRPFVTVYSPSMSRQIKINLNTVHPYILEALVFSLAGADFTKRELFEKVLKFRAGKQSFWQEDLESAAFIQKLGLNNSPSEIVLLNQFLGFLTVDSQYFSVRIRSRLTRQESFVLDVVLGTRVFVPPMTGSQGTSLARSSRQVVSLPLEILSWRESYV